MSEATDKMRAEGLPDIAINTFAHYERLLGEGDEGTLPEAELEPLDDVQGSDDLPDGDPADLERAVVLKLNGGLGTSMGMTKAKSLVEVKDGQTFLDVIARQVLHLRERHGAPIPLLLMNSFATRDDTLEALERYPDLRLDGLPLDFMQGKVPKLLADDDHGPVSWEADPSLEWAPPGHGDVFTSLASSGMLDTLLDRGYEYLFLSNSDNLGAVLEPRILELVRARGAAVPLRGGGPHRGRPEGRAPGAPRRRRRAGAARDGAGAGGRPGGVRGHRSATASSTRTTSG